MASGPGGVRVSPVMLGRDDLVAVAARRRSAAADGEGQLLLLAGEAGVGKTRLLDHLCSTARDDGWDVVRAAAFPRDVEVVAGLLLDLGDEVARTDPSRGDRFARAVADGASPGAADARRRTLVGDLSLALAALGDGPRPVLLALEDLHWADEITLDALERLARRLAGRPMFVVCTFRTDELYPSVPTRRWRSRMLTQRLAEELRLRRLDREDTGAMVAAITGATWDVTVLDALYERSDGIPLHVEELIGAGALVPDTLADAVLGRAASLTPDAWSLACTAAVIGRSFDVDLLVAITGEPPTDVDRELTELVDQFLVLPRDDAGTFIFRHALIRDALVESIPPLHRRELHAAVAAGAAGLGDAFLSDQYERARLGDLAHPHALAAARQAAAVSAHREAEGLYERALRTAPSDLPPRDRAALLAELAGELVAIDENGRAVEHYEQAQALWVSLGDVTAAAAVAPAVAAGRHLLGADLDERTRLLDDAAVGVRDPAVLAHLESALAAAYMLDRRLDESIEHSTRARALAAGLQQTATTLDIDATLGSVLVFAGRGDEGWPLLEQAVRAAEAQGAEAAAARGYRMIGSSASVLVEYDRARQWLTEGIAYSERVERWNDRHYMTAHLGHVHWATGDWTGADALVRSALRDGDHGLTTRITTLHVLGYLAMGRADLPAARDRLDEARALGEQMRELQRISPALWGLAETALLAGDTTAAVDWCRRGYAASREVDDAAYLFPFVVTGTRAHLLAGDRPGARAWVEATSALLRRRAVPGTLPALDHARGLVELADGRTGAAREALETASLAWHERGRFWEGTYALLDRAQCALRARRSAEAAELAGRAHDAAAPPGATALVTLADDILARAVPDGSAGPLTARETEIAALVAAGATNVQIAATLTISPKTVGAHVEHILTKLGAARRAEIAAWYASTSNAAGQRSARP